MKDAKRLLHPLLFLLLVGGVAGAIPAQAQQEISGTVTDSTSGETLPGVSVVVAGTQLGAVTGPDGTYQITGIEPGTYTLRASFVGYGNEVVEGVEVEEGETSTVDFTMAQTVEALDEVVVVGYGEQEVGDVTGVVQTVEEEEFNTGRVVSPEKLISGKVAGVQISGSGEPGGDPLIRIRGGTSVNASNEPLFVVDGVPLADGGGISSGRNPLNFINPNDIQNVTVLKDASATAIYGARGANGVILIETKSGAGGTQVSYRGSVSSSRAIGGPGVLGAEQFRDVVSEQAPAVMDQLGDANTDWRDAVLGPATGQEHNLGISGGRENLNYRLSLGYLDQNGVVETSGTNRVTASLKYNHHLFDDALDLKANIKGARTQDDYAPEPVVGNATLFAPTQPIRDPGSEFGGFFEWENSLGVNNPVAEYSLVEDAGTTYRSVGNIEGDYQLPFLDGLSANLNLGYDITKTERETFAPSFLRRQVENDIGGEVRRENFTQSSTLLDAYLGYESAFEDYSSNFDVTAGYSFQEFQSAYPFFYAQDLSTNLLGPNSTSPAGENYTDIYEERNRLISGFARLNYSFRDRYLLTLSVRRDGSSRFSPENQWGTFPSAALAWRISEEGFADRFEAVSDLKLRASWGITGNQEIGNSLFRTNYVFGGPQARVQFGDEFVTTLRPGGADPTLKWEETTSYNLGLDYGFLDGRLSGAVEYYYKETADLLFPTPVPAGSNLTNIVTTNVGTVRNRGVELNVSAQVFEASSGNGFAWNAGFNASTNDNELLKINDFSAPDFQGISTGGIAGGVGNTIQILQEGEPVNSFFVYRHKEGPDGDPLVDGVDHNEDGTVDDADIYKDLNGDGQVNEQDRAPYESPAPNWILGHTSQTSYGDFDLSFTLRAHLGNHVYNNVASNMGHYSALTTNAPINLHESVLETNFDAPQYFSDVYVEDASFLRMDNFTLGYTVDDLPGVAEARVFATVENAFTLTGYSGVDPEVGLGIDNNLYPQSRTFIGGVDLQF